MSYSSQLQDIGIRNRVAVKPPVYRNKYEFLHEVETSDEEEERVRDAAMQGTVEGNIKKGPGRALLSSNTNANIGTARQRDAVTTASTN